MDNAADTSEITMELRNHVQKLVVSNSFVKLAKLKLFGISDDELRALFDLMVWDITTGSAGFWEYVMNKVTTREYLVSNHQLEVTEEEARSMFARDVLLRLKERKAAV